MNFSVADLEKEILLTSLRTANLRFQQTYPGDKPDRQAVHTVYGGANLFKADTCVKMGDIALKNLQTYSPDFITLANVLNMEGCKELPDDEKKKAKLIKKLDKMSKAERKQHPAWLSYTVYNKIIRKLQTEAVEDFRIDFEDGFGNRPDAEEDATAINAANELAEGMKNKTISPFIGIRIKPFTEDLKSRGVRTLDIFLTALLQKSGGKLPDNFIVMLPKVTIPEQVITLIRLFEIIEKKNNLAPGTLKMETM
ncbi:MAG TPA: phosphoenolpyruvate kinase, partial [Chitinophagaceae bacterium]